MTTACPDWAALVREREHAERSPDVGAAAVDRAWKDALRHRADCGHCRAVSLQADPLLLFSGNFASGDFNGARDRTDVAHEVDELRKRVRLELEGRAAERRLNAARTARRRMPIASVLAAGAAAAALGLSFLLWPETAPPADDVLGSELSGAGLPVLHTADMLLGAGDRLPAHVAMAPLVEPLGDEPMGVFQLPGNGLASSLDVVLVVTEIAP